MTFEELEKRQADLEQQATATEQRAKSNTHRLDKLEKRQSDLEQLTTSVAILATKQEGMESDVKETKADVKDIQSDVKAIAAQKGRRWDGLMDKLLWAVIGGVFAIATARWSL